MTGSELKQYLNDNNIKVIIHHRTANSFCVRKYIPPITKYVVVNHTWNNMNSMKSFLQCDLFISVCNFLHTHTSWNGLIYPSRRLVILNGIENEFSNDVEPVKLEGSFITGRCHRLAGAKFHADSLSWIGKKVIKKIAGFTHYLIGQNDDAKVMCKKYDNIKYLGTITDKNTKISYIKSFDLYFYETFQDEGASIAILEALSVGVPVICRSKGGNRELVYNGINGMIAENRNDFLNKMSKLTDRNLLQQYKEQTLKDFNSRLHIKHAVCKYMQIIERLSNG